MTSDIFFLKNEAVEQLGQMVVNYWQVGILAILFTLTLYILSKRWSIPPLPKETGHQESRAFFLGKRLAIGLVLIVVTVIFIRGGFQKKVLKPIHAYTLGQFDLGNLILNSTFTLLKGDLYQGKAKVTYFKTKDKALRHIHNSPFEKKNTFATKDNVVLIILESFATEFWGAANSYSGYTPFLDSLAKKGLFFKRNFSNSHNSINAFFSILFGIPPLMRTPPHKI